MAGSLWVGPPLSRGLRLTKLAPPCGSVNGPFTVREMGGGSTVGWRLKQGMPLSQSKRQVVVWFYCGQQIAWAC